MPTVNQLARTLLFFLLLVASVVAAWIVFVLFPDTTRELLGVLLVVALIPVFLKVSATVSRSIATPYTVAEVAITGPITRDTSASPLGAAPVGTSANAAVDQIDRADADGSVDALLVRLNTPGGEIVPSEDIKHAVERFDGPAVAYATDTCASGGYEIASGCDEIWARDGSIVGSIGVIGSRINAADLADRLGISYEQLTAGEFKDAGVPLKEFEEHEREYLQTIVDDYYDKFVTNVAERRDMDPETLRDTEARVYLGDRAYDLGLVDYIGRRSDVEDRLEELIDRTVTVEQFEPQRGIVGQFGAGARGVAYALGAGIASAFTEDGTFTLR